MTPSGLIIGTILNINESLKEVAIGSFDSMNYISPCSIQDDVVSEGWTLAVMKTIFLFKIIYLAASFCC